MTNASVQISTVLDFVLSPSTRYNGVRSFILEYSCALLRVRSTRAAQKVCSQARYLYPAQHGKGDKPDTAASYEGCI